ncbi:MAG: hypothetical protein AAB855_02415, partial [Patescibacteria group bacterium]
QDKCREEVNKMIGLRGRDKKKAPNIILALFFFIAEVAQYVIQSAVKGSEPTAREAVRKREDEKGVMTDLMYLPSYEQDLVKKIEMKSSKLGYKSKIRILYLGPKDLVAKNRKRAVQGIMGVFRQFNAHDANTFGLGKRTFVRAYYYFVKYRLNRRKRILMRAYKRRSVSRGDRKCIVNVEELATLWHFPSLDISAPLLRKADVKRGEPPASLPMPEFENPPPRVEQKPKDVVPENLPFV